MTVFGRYGLRTRQASNLVFRTASSRDSGAPYRKVRGGAIVVPLFFFASLVSAGQNPAEKRAGSLVAATRIKNAAWARGQASSDSKSNLPPRRPYDSVLAPCSFWVLFPSRGGVSFKGARSSELGQRYFPNPFSPPATTTGARVTSRRGTCITHSFNRRGDCNPSLGWLGPCRSNHLGQQWPKAFELQSCHPAHDSHGPLRCASELPGAPLITARWRSCERAF